MTQVTAVEKARPVKQTLGHVSVHYRNPDEGPLAARLFELLGLRRQLGFPLPDGTWFYQYYVERDGPSGADGIIFLSALPQANRAIIAAIGEALRVGMPGEHPAVAGLLAAQAADPESQFHVGILLDSLEAIEETILNFQQLDANDPDLKGRIKTIVNRARPGNPDIDRRLDDSPLYRDVKRYTYGRGGVQAFIETDVLTTGPLGGPFVVELDYVFPGQTKHILNSVEL
jgi:hypothetical protein